MRSPAEALAVLRSRLERRWSQVLAGAEPWRAEVPLNTSSLTGARLVAAWAQVRPIALEWERWAADAGPGVGLRRRTVRLHGSEQSLPSALVVEDLPVAAGLVGAEWPERVAVGEARLARLRLEFPEREDPAEFLRRTDGWPDADFDILCRAARWFADDHPPGLTARQVPVEGMGTKWLDQRQVVVRRLAGVDDLALEPGRPRRVHLTYLDPAHRAAGGRRHDVATEGDVDALAYRPSIVVISENRDTAQAFPDLPGGIAVEGDGNGPGAVPHLAWVAQADDVVYWGDMDAKGLEILDAYRAALRRPVRSILMELADYERWRRFGVDHDHDNRPIGRRPALEVPELTDGERALYEELTSPTCAGPLRIEQERLPLTEAVARVRGRR